MGAGAFAMAETLEAGSAAVEALGPHPDVRMPDYWQPVQTFFSFIRDRTAINAMLKQVGGKRGVDGKMTATGKVQKKVTRDFLTGSEGRDRDRDWLLHGGSTLYPRSRCKH
jgi:ParB family chromosome partitioning protein